MKETEKPLNRYRVYVCAITEQMEQRMLVEWKVENGVWIAALVESGKSTSAVVQTPKRSVLFSIFY